MSLPNWLRKRAWSVCWEIGDTFMGWAMKLEGPPDETWTRIEVHKNCQPKPTFQVTTATVPTWSTSASTATSWFSDWDSPEDSAYDK